MMGTFRRHPDGSDRAAGRPEGARDESAVSDTTAGRPSVQLELMAIDTFERFYESEYGPLLGLGYQLTGRRDVAEDVVQDAMIQAFRRWGRVSSYDRPELWVRRVLLNLVASRWRRQRTAARSLFRLVRLDEVPGPSAETDEVWRIVRGLPRRQAEAVALYYGCDLSVADVAAILDCAPGTVRTHLARGRSTLAGRLTNPENES